MGKVLDIKEPEKKESNSHDVEEEVKEEEAKEGEETEEAPDIKFVCGIVVSMGLDGSGIVLAPVQHPEYSRVATIHDIVMLLADAQKTVDVKTITDSVMHNITQFKDMRRAMGKLNVQ